MAVFSAQTELGLHLIPTPLNQLMCAIKLFLFQFPQWNEI